MRQAYQRRINDSCTEGYIKRSYVKKNKTSLMIQGTGSNAGKSILVSALCRIFLQDGYNVAPFKSQNMSLNSFVTANGEEMGRAQAVQARACRLEPDTRMNPLLLKPNTDTGCQVILHGKPVKNMEVYEYIDYKSFAYKEVTGAYDSLADEHDVIVLEGAGSPAEINLKEHDIVNMKMARHAGSPVVLVGDIDRGGVFASFVGTYELFEEWEKDLLAGFIINKFRGDETLLKDAIDFTYHRTGRPTFGTVPYIHDPGIPEEDSVEMLSACLDRETPAGEYVDIALIDLAHISNFTDIDPFVNEPDVYIRKVGTSDELGAPDAVIIPGSKNVITDLERLKVSGLADAVRALALNGRSEIIGICGGYQMLGREIRDPYKIESRAGRSDGIGLLSADTLLSQDKRLKLVNARHLISGMEIRGYEIHHGVTDSSAPVFEMKDGTAEGSASGDGRIWGTYIHGVFDADGFRRWFIDSLRERKGLKPAGRVLSVYDIEPAIDRLADVVRKSVDIDALYRVMGL